MRYLSLVKDIIVYNIISKLVIFDSVEVAEASISEFYDII